MTLEQRAAWLRREIFEMVIRQQAGHIPSSFSMVEILVSLFYGGQMKYGRGNPRNPNRDRVIISKGHAAMAVYPILEEIEYIPKGSTEEFTQPGALLGMYPDPRTPGVDGVAGSLGHGLGLATGIELARKLDGKEGHSYVIIGDGECYEGSTWEAALLTVHHKLPVTVLIDQNEFCILGKTDDLLPLGDLEVRFSSMGWDAVTIDGHSFDDIQGALGVRTRDIPLAIIAKTTKGKGISFMEGAPLWHNRMPNPEMEAQAREELS
jgi:transketolase